jgi:hypothetical protein
LEQRSRHRTIGKAIGKEKHKWPPLILTDWNDPCKHVQCLFFLLEALSSINHKE